MGLFGLVKGIQDTSEVAMKAAKVLDELKTNDENKNGIPDGVEIFSEVSLGFASLEQARSHFDKAGKLAGDNIENVCEVLGLKMPEMPKPAAPKEAPAKPKVESK
jgi:hypothetical protein